MLLTIEPRVTHLDSSCHRFTAISGRSSLLDVAAFPVGEAGGVDASAVRDQAG
jgi:hypothetical protein